MSPWQSSDIVRTISVDGESRNQIARRTRFQVSQVVRQCRKDEQIISKNQLGKEETEPWRGEKAGGQLLAFEKGKLKWWEEEQR